jgi:hypothetical protein
MVSRKVLGGSETLRTVHTTPRAAIQRTKRAGRPAAKLALDIICDFVGLRFGRAAADGGYTGGMEAFVHDAVLDMQHARNDLLAALAEVGDGDWGRYVPYGERTLHDLLAHLATADHAWALAAQGLLKGEAEQQPPLTPAEAAAARAGAVKSARKLPPAELIAEMERRRRLLLSLYELLEPRHLALALRSFGDRHNSVRERIWLGYHDRMHAADVRRALALTWQPQHLRLLPEVQGAADSLKPDAALYVIYNVDPVQWQRPSPLPGWSFHDLLAHIATGDWVLQGHLRHVIEHGRVAAWPDIDAGNAQRIEERRHTTEGRLAEEYLSTRHETLRLIAGLKLEHLRLTFEISVRPFEITLADMLDWFHPHEETHAEQLRPAMKYVRAQGGA